jgi:hypothetical protein
MGSKSIFIPLHIVWNNNFIWCQRTYSQIKFSDRNVFFLFFVFGCYWSLFKPHIFHSYNRILAREGWVPKYIYIYMSSGSPSVKSNHLQGCAQISMDDYLPAWEIICLSQYFQCFFYCQITGIEKGFRAA